MKLFMVLIGISLSLLLVGCQQRTSAVKRTESKTEQKAKKTADPKKKKKKIVKEKKKTVKAAKYKVANTEQADYNVLERKIYRIVVKVGLVEKRIKATIDQLIKTETKSDPDLDEIRVLVYDNEVDINGPHTVGKADWASNGEWGSTTAQSATNNFRTTHAASYQFVNVAE